MKAKAQISDKVKIVNEKELRSLYDENNYNQNNTLQSLLWLSNYSMIGYVKNITVVSDELVEYDVSFPSIVESIKLYDSDFYVVKELYTEIPVYLCVDEQGGMCDRLCFGDNALIKNANASIDTWNNSQNEEHYEHVTDVDKATSILIIDNFKVAELQPNHVYYTDEYIVTDCTLHNYNKEERIIHNPKHIYNLIQKGEIKKDIVDLTITY